jgi:hypothetical protein
MAKKPPKPTDRHPSPRHKGKAKTPPSNFMTQQWKNLPEFKDVLVEIRTQSNRGAAITAGVTVENALRLAIEAHWSRTMSKSARERVFCGRGGALGTFSAKIDVANAMGLVDQQTTDYLNTVRRIRNEFAHSMIPITFASERIRTLCDDLPEPDFLAGSATLIPPMDINERMRGLFIEKAYDLMLLLIGDLEIDDASPDKST